MDSEVPHAFAVAESNRIDVNRSSLITSARSLMSNDVNTDPAEPWLMMVDTDVLPITSMDDALRLAVADQQLGFDLICSPLTKLGEADGKERLLAVALGAVVPTRSLAAPFEVEASSLGFSLFSPRLLKRLAPIGWWRTFDGRRIELFCEMNSSSEDFDLCMRIRRIGFRVGCDPRIEAFHVKDVRLGPWGSGGVLPSRSSSGNAPLPTSLKL